VGWSARAEMGSLARSSSNVPTSWLRRYRTTCTGGASEAIWVPSVALDNTRLPVSASTYSTPVIPTLAWKLAALNSGRVSGSLRRGSLVQFVNELPRTVQTVSDVKFSQQGVTGQDHGMRSQFEQNLLQDGFQLLETGHPVGDAGDFLPFGLELGLIILRRQGGMTPVGSKGGNGVGTEPVGGCPKAFRTRSSICSRVP